jgi:hypothetical protein
VKLTAFNNAGSAVSGNDEEDSILGLQNKVETIRDSDEPGKVRKSEDSKLLHGASGSKDLSDRFGRSKYKDKEITVVTTVEQSIERKISAPIPSHHPQSPRRQKSLPNAPASFKHKPSTDSFRHKSSDDEMSERDIVLERDGV